MTGLEQKTLAERYFTEAEKYRALGGKLLRAVAGLLAVACLLSLLLLMSRQLEICYTVGEKVVTVESGDTVWDFAVAYKGEYPGGLRSYMAKILTRNGIEDPEKIAVGSKIILPIYRYRFG